MSNRKGTCVLLLALALTLFTPARAQDSSGVPSRAEINHEVHVHLLVTSEAAEGGTRTPQSLEPVVRQLKSSLPPSEYRLAATFINRVRDGAAFDVKTAGAGPLGPVPTPGPLTPAFINLSLSGVKLIDPASAQPSISVNQFRLGMKVPVQTAAVKSDKGDATFPVIQYEDVGVSTQLSVREGEPTLVGTLNATRPGQLYVIVITIRRTGR